MKLYEKPPKCDGRDCVRQHSSTMDTGYNIDAKIFSKNFAKILYFCRGKYYNIVIKIKGDAQNSQGEQT